MKHSYKQEKTIFSDIIICWLNLKEVNLNSDPYIIKYTYNYSSHKCSLESKKRNMKYSIHEYLLKGIKLSEIKALTLIIIS